MPTTEEARTFAFGDVEVAWNGVTDDPWFDVDLHDDNRPADESTVAVRVSFTEEEAEQFANRILEQVTNFRKAAARL